MPGAPIWSSGRIPHFGRRGNAENAFAVKNELIIDATLAMQPDAAALLGQLDHLYEGLNEPHGTTAQGRSTLTAATGHAPYSSYNRCSSMGSAGDVGPSSCKESR